MASDCKCSVSRLFTFTDMYSRTIVKAIIVTRFFPYVMYFTKHYFQNSSLIGLPKYEISMSPSAKLTGQVRVFFSLGFLPLSRLAPMLPSVLVRKYIKHPK